jgi:hypothetical protein
MFGFAWTDADLPSQENYFLHQAGLLVTRRPHIVQGREQLFRFVTSRLS